MGVDVAGNLCTKGSVFAVSVYLLPALFIFIFSCIMNNQRSRPLCVYFVYLLLLCWLAGDPVVGSGEDRDAVGAVGAVGSSQDLKEIERERRALDI